MRWTRSGAISGSASNRVMRLASSAGSASASRTKTTWSSLLKGLQINCTWYSLRPSSGRSSWAVRRCGHSRSAPRTCAGGRWAVQSRASTGRRRGADCSRGADRRPRRPLLGRKVLSPAQARSCAYGTTSHSPAKLSAAKSQARAAWHPWVWRQRPPKRVGQTQSRVGRVNRGTFTPTAEDCCQTVECNGGRTCTVPGGPGLGKWVSDPEARPAQPDPRVDGAHRLPRPLAVLRVSLHLQSAGGHHLPAGLGPRPLVGTLWARERAAPHPGHAVPGGRLPHAQRQRVRRHGRPAPGRPEHAAHDSTEARNGCVHRSCCATVSDANPGSWPPHCPETDFAFALPKRAGCGA